MKNPLFSKFAVVWILFSLLAFLNFVSCSGDDKDKITNGTTMPEQIVSGKWNAPTGFGELQFTVNPEGTYITEFKLTFDDWTLGNTTRNGSIAFSLLDPPGWQIVDREFSFDGDMDPSPGDDDIMTVSGSFDATGSEASGTWQAESDGATDSGTWQASPENE